MGNRTQAYLVALPPSLPLATLRGSYLQTDTGDSERGAGHPHPVLGGGFAVEVCIRLALEVGRGLAGEGPPDNSERSVSRRHACVHAAAAGGFTHLGPCVGSPVSAAGYRRASPLHPSPGASRSAASAFTCCMTHASSFPGDPVPLRSQALVSSTAAPVRCTPRGPERGGELTSTKGPVLGASPGQLPVPSHLMAWHVLPSPSALQSRRDHNLPASALPPGCSQTLSLPFVVGMLPFSCPCPHRCFQSAARIPPLPAHPVISPSEPSPLFTPAFLCATFCTF